MLATIRSLGMVSEIIGIETGSIQDGFTCTLPLQRRRAIVNVALDGRLSQVE